MKYLKRKNSRGFSAIEIMVAVGLVSVLGLTMASFTSYLTKSSQRASQASSLESVRLELLAALNDELAFKNTLLNPANAVAFDCLLSSKDCLPMSGAGAEIQIFNANNDRISYSSLSSEPTKGFDQHGVVCDTFNPLGSRSCPFKFVAVWRAYCPPHQNLNGLVSTEVLCRNPLINVKISLASAVQDSKHTTALNLAKQNIEVTKSQVASTPKTVCQMVSGGTWDDTTKRCLIAVTASCSNVCTAPETPFIQGFDLDGKPTCTCVPPVAVKECPRGQVLLAIDNQGSITCGSGVLPSMVASGAINNPPQGVMLLQADAPPAATDGAAVVTTDGAAATDGALPTDGSGGGDGDGDGGA